VAQKFIVGLPFKMLLCHACSKQFQYTSFTDIETESENLIIVCFVKGRLHFATACVIAVVQPRYSTTGVPHQRHSHNGVHSSHGRKI